MFRPVIVISLMALPACATTAPAEPADPPTRELAGSCNADAARAMVGQRATQEVGQRIVAATRARALRWGPPNSAMTMDYSPDRVNVFYNSAMVIERVTCG